MKRIVSLFLVLALMLSCLPLVAMAEDDRTVIKIMAPRYRDGSKRDLTLIEQNDTYQVFDSWLAEKGIRIEWEAVANEQYSTVTNTRFAAGTDMPDFVSIPMTEAEAVAYGEAGLLVDVLAAIKQYDDDGSILAYWDKYFPETIGMLTTAEGKMYWVPSMSGAAVIPADADSFQYVGNDFLPCLRLDWMEKLGIEYKLEGMTMDELYQIITEFRAKDANGNGLQDEVVGVDISSFDTGIAQMFGLPISIVWPNATAGTIECAWYNEGLKDYITFMKKLYDDGLYDTSVIGNSKVLDTMISENKVGMIYTYPGQGWIEPTIAGVEKPVYVPTFPSTQYFPNLKAESFAPVIHSRYFIPATCQNVEAVVDLLDIIYSERFAMMNWYGLEGLGWTRNEDGTINSLLDYGRDASDPNAKGISMNWLTYGLPSVNVRMWSKAGYAAESTGYDEKRPMMVWLSENQDKFDRSDNVPVNLSLPTAEEIEKLNEIESTLKTFSSETLTQLILGNYPMDDLDAYIEEMKAIGLDEYIAIYQARMDRANAAK